MMRGAWKICLETQKMLLDKDGVQKSILDVHLFFRNINLHRGT
jgi:hypothetical protein